jgi:outer membrane protein assembly factor BamB
MHGSLTAVMRARSSKLPSLKSFLLPLMVLCCWTLATAEDPPLALSKPLTLKWRYESDQTSNLTPTTDGKTVYLPLANGILVALNAADGKLRWRADAGGEFSAAPVVDEHVLYLATQYPGVEAKTVRGTLRAISKDTGITLWLRTLPSPVRGSVAPGGNVVFGGAANGSVYAFNKQNGLTIWMNQYGDSFEGHPVFWQNRLYIGSVGGWLLALDGSSGQTVWRYHTRGAIRGSIGIANTVIIFGSDDNYVYAFDEWRGKLVWKRRTGAAVQDVEAVATGVLACSFDNFAYLFSLKKGAVVWRQLLPGRIPAKPVVASDGALFTPLSTDNAIVLGLKDGKPVNRLELGEENASSAAPIVAGNNVLITTPHGLLAFAAPE